MNALSGDTPIFAEVDGKYGVYTLQELFELHNEGKKIRVPALLNKRGKKIWVEVEDVVSFGTQPLKQIMLATTHLFVKVSEDTIIPAYSMRLFRGKEKLILKFKFVNELKVTQFANNDTILLTMRIHLNLPEGDQTEWELGFALGFYIAEGSTLKRKRSFSKRSLEKLNGFAKNRGMALQDYLNYMSNIKLVILTVGEPDFERGFIDNIKRHFKFSKSHKRKVANAYDLYSSDLRYIHLIKENVDGYTSHDKHLKNVVYNRSLKFLAGILDGFLAGDGTYIKNMNLFAVNITTNYRLYNDLIFLSKALGYDVHINKGSFGKSPSSNKFYYALRLSILKNWHRFSAFGLVKERIKMVENAGVKEAFNLVLKPLYEENDKRAKFNRLYFTAYGFLVSDAVKTF